MWHREQRQGCLLEVFSNGRNHRKYHDRDADFRCIAHSLPRDELNGHPPGSDGPMATALKRHNGGRVLVFVVGAFAEMSEDVSRICGISFSSGHCHSWCRCWWRGPL